MLGVSGWFSTNILGNRDGEVLDQPENFKTKEVSKLSVIDNIFEPEKFPDLYGDVYHKVRINYYPPRKDNKEAWDNIDIFGWMGYPMEIKVNFLCRDSILAAPIALDLVIFSDLALRAGMCGIQTWLSFNKLESCWGEDPSRVVVDEMVGVWIPLLAVPDNDRWYWYVIAAFALFRIFDIVKPLGVRKMENFKGGVGVMMDDVLAGVYSFILIAVARWVIG